jgi:serine/threonine protein phosphatase PrpC
VIPLPDWCSFGASVIGPGHISTSKPNQDAWLSFHNSWGDGIAVSDGLGSKPLSEFGSLFACRSVKRATHSLSRADDIAKGLTGDDRSRFLESIHSNWLEMVKPLPPRDASATCLFAFSLGDGRIWAGMLGDGCVAVAKKDGGVVILADDKSSSFSNMTSALSATFDDRHWQLSSIPEDETLAIILCTDGVSDDLEDIKGFVQGFIEAYCGLPVVSAARSAREMLENWPTPKHSDDKTIACLFKREPDDEQ